MGEQFRFSLRILNSLLVLFGAISIIVGGLSLHFACQNVEHGWPANSGVGVWAGALLILTGMLGIIVGRNHGSPVMINCWNSLFVVFNGVGLVVAIQLVVHPSTLIDGCRQNPLPAYCTSARDGIITMATAHIALGVFFLPILFMNYILYFWMAKAHRTDESEDYQEMK